MTSSTKLHELKKQVYEACMALQRNHISFFAESCVSGIDREKGFAVIKPSGTECISVIDIETDCLLEGKSNPDIPTHLELYRQFPSAGGITHVQSQWISFFAGEERDLKLCGECFGGTIPCRKITALRDIDPTRTHAVLVPSLGAVTWSGTPMGSAEYAVILECVAKMAYTKEILLKTP